MKRSPWLGFAIAPATAPVFYGILALFISDVTQKKEFGATSWFISILFFTLVSYVVSFMLGFPLLKVLKKYKKVTVMWVVGCGAVLYAISLYVVLFHIMGAEIIGEPLPVIGTILLVGFGLGVLVSSVFCLISGITPMRRNRSPKNGAAGS